MNVRPYKNHNGTECKEITSRQYQELVSLGAEYKRKGADVSISPFDMCEGLWALTVSEKKAA